MFHSVVRAFLVCRSLQIVQDRTVAPLTERPLCDRDVVGSIPGRVIPETLKVVFGALLPGAQHQDSGARDPN